MQFCCKSQLHIWDNFNFEWQCAQVGVEKVTLNGRVRITLKPLVDEMPIVAAMQVRHFRWRLLTHSLVNNVVSIKDYNDNRNGDDDVYNNNENMGTCNMQQPSRQATWLTRSYQCCATAYNVT